MLLREFWNDRFWPYCTRNLRESTCVGYESAWRLHVMPCFGGMDMGAISVELVDKWLADFDTAGAARKAWAVLRAILRRAIRWNLLDVDTTKRDIQLPAKPHYEPTILSIRQQRALLQGFYDHPLEAWLICAVSCGLRTEEGYGLEWGDIDLRAGILPEGWRPPTELNFSYGGRDGDNQKAIIVQTNGALRYINQGGEQGTSAFGLAISLRHLVRPARPARLDTRDAMLPHRC